MAPRKLTYVLQAFSAFFMLATAVLGYMASIHGQHSIVITNCILFWINFSLFYWQYRIRRNLWRPK